MLLLKASPEIEERQSLVKEEVPRIQGRAVEPSMDQLLAIFGTKALLRCWTSPMTGLRFEHFQRHSKASFPFSKMYLPLAAASNAPFARAVMDDKLPVACRAGFTAA
ncbi:hypothetical protein J3458_022446 [Metarhizium acridum]|uniref:uncharacterized protein n=1 Tax=Metarhizium acridum TaxID=92637 RepID=UPI001C6BF5F2|nr:hypothetical protein J3458_022446 [Metarhizium acridum]